MQVKVAIECYMCKADATVLAHPNTSLTLSIPVKHAWKLCEACSKESTKYGPCWVVVGKVEPVIKTI